MTDASTTRGMMSGGGGDSYYIDARNADSAGFERLRTQLLALHASVEPRAIAAVASFNRRLAPN